MHILKMICQASKYLRVQPVDFVSEEKPVGYKDW